MDRWDKSRRLSETVHVPEIWKPYFNDYQAHVFEIAYLSPEQVKMFKSDFGIVADYFVQKRMTGDYIGSSEDIRHIDEVMKLLAVFADKRFMDNMVISSSSNCCRSPRFTLYPRQLQYRHGNPHDFCLRYFKEPSSFYAIYQLWKPV